MSDPPAGPSAGPSADRDRDRRRILVGVGNRDRGDDAVGPSVCDRVGSLGSDVEVWVVEADPSTLAVRWRPDDRVVVVDAVVTGAPAGTLHRLDPTLLAADRAVSTHGLGVAETIRLSTALGTLPHDLTVLGVEAERFEHGTPITAAVARSIDDAAVLALSLLAAGGGDQLQPDLPATTERAPVSTRP